MKLISFFTNTIARRLPLVLAAFFLLKNFSASGQSAPGGYSTNGQLWLKANAGTGSTTDGNTFTTWTTYLGATSASGGSNATFRNNSTDNINYNPVAEFNGTSQYLNIASNLSLTSTSATVFSVQRMASGAAGNDAILGSQANTTGAPLVYVANGSAPYSLVISRLGASTVTSNSQIQATTPTITGVRRTGTTAVKFWFNGTDQTSGTPTMSSNFASTNKRIGSTQGSANQWFLAADLAEVIVYNSSLADADVRKIETYLAIKYGITLSNDYVDAGGNTIWNRTTNTGYNNNIAGIGRDSSGSATANSQLVQKQSRSVNTSSSGDLVVMGLNSIAANNRANSGSFSANRSFLIWGDNGGANAWQSTETPSANRQRLTREWKVEESGTVGSVVVRVSDNSAISGGEIPAEVGTVYLLVDADGDFSSGATSVAMTLTGTNWEANYDFTDGQYFTFATGVSGYLAFGTPSVSACIDHPLMDVATMSVSVSWENAPAGDTIEVNIYGQTERIAVAGGATSPQTVNFTFPADGTTGNSLTANWQNAGSTYTVSTTYNAPAACSNDTIACKILYLCGLDKPYDGDPWDHGLFNYFDAVNGSKTVYGILTKADASGMGTYNLSSPSTFENVTLTDYDLIVVSATTEGSIAADLVNALKNFAGSILNSNWDIQDDLGYSATPAYQFQTNAYTDNTTSVEIYNFNNIYPSAYTPVFTNGDYPSQADGYLWTYANDQTARTNAIYYTYSSSDALVGVTGAHGRRVYLGYHMNGVYMNWQNGGALPAPVETYINPAKHFTLIGKTYFDNAIIDASIPCKTEICVNGIDDNDDGLVDCADSDCPSVSISSQPLSESLCFGVGETISVTASGGTGLSYQWQYNSGSWGNVANGSPTGSTYSGETTSALTVSGANIPDGNYNYRVTISNSVGCTAVSNSATLTVRNIAANAGADIQQCGNGNFTMSANAPAGYTGNWTLISGTGTISNPNSATSAVSLTTTNGTLVWTLTADGCTDADTIDLEWVHVFVLASNNSPFCPGSNVNLYAAPDGYVSYAWTGPNGFSSSSQNPIISNATSSYSGTYTVTVTDSNGCTSNTNTVVTVYNAPVPPGTIGY